MYRALFAFFLILTSLAHADFADKRITLKTTRYDLDWSVDFEKAMLTAACRIEVKNTASDDATVVPLLLYKMMTVHSIQGANRQELTFTQRNLFFDDMDSMEVNFVEVTLPEPLAKNKRTTLDIRYDGFMQGYVETGMLYTQDRISPEFTLLRMDCYAYPIVGYPNRVVDRKSGLQAYDYVISVTVPEGYTAANGGRLTGIGSKDGRAVFTFQNIKPAWRMDVAIAKYGQLSNGANNVYYLPGDATGGANVLAAMETCMELYTRWFGPLHAKSGFTVIEIPEGYGSQSDVTSILQTADAFKDSSQLHQVYHEVSHQWNVRSTDPLPCRWEEGLATFLEWRTADELDRTDKLDQTMNWLAGRIKDDLAKNPEIASVAPVDFGTKQIEGMSYTVGAVACRVLWELVGQEEFVRLIGDFYQEKEANGATAREFVSYLTAKASLDLTAYANDWWLGTGWAEQMKTSKPIAEIVKMYR